MYPEKKGNVGHVTASKQRKTGHVGLSNESSITSHRFSFSCKAIKDSLKLLFTSSVNEEKNQKFDILIDQSLHQHHNDKDNKLFSLSESIL